MEAGVMKLSTVYVLEVYEPTKRRYHEVWSSYDYDRAIKMFDKPYYKKLTRRLIRIETEIALKAEAS